MSYYMGDFYGSGGYYRGDPFWGFLGRIAKGAIKIATGLGGGGGARPSLPPPGPAAGMASAAIERVKPAIMTAARATGRMIVKHPVLSAAGAAGALGVGVGAVGHRVLAHRVDPITGQVLRRRRRMNPCNPKALRRAIRRATKFTHLAMKTIHLVHPKKKVRFGGWKRKRKAA